MMLRLRPRAHSYRLALESGIDKENELQITINGMVREVAERTTVADLLARLEMRPQQVAVEVNRDLVPRTRHQTHVLSANDTVEIVTLVGGG